MKASSRNLSGNWISTLIDHQKLYNETVKISQDGNNIHVQIKLPYSKKAYDYEFNGKINKNIIHGIYSSKNSTETGTISLKSVSNNILYGFCTFIHGNKKEDISQSPYLLVRNRNIRLGTYDFCTNCIGKKHNCCCHPWIDMPVILPFEVFKIKNKFHLKNKDFCQKINNVYRMKRNANTHGCVFYQNNQCQIYSERPLDCRMFPFDIMMDKKDEPHLISYNKSICKKFTNVKTISNQIYTIRPLIKFFWPYLHEYSSKKFSKRLGKREYVDLGNIKNFF